MSLLAQIAQRKATLNPTETIVRTHPAVSTGLEGFGKRYLGEKQEEIDEDESVTREAARGAAEIIRASSYTVVHTGAGVSTSAGVGDFRSNENGVWSLLARGRIPDDSSDITNCIPTKAHMAIKALVEEGIVKEVISTNHDGLHMKSGLRIGENLHELHGNTYVERCVRCFKEYQQQFPVLRTDDRYTGRDCTCGGRLWDSGVDFGQTLPLSHVHAATIASKKADVHLVLGSSLQVAPSSLLPRQYGGRLILVNRGRTPADGPAGTIAVRSYGQIDTFMEELLRALDVNLAPAPTLMESGFISVKMLLFRRQAVRERCLTALANGELDEVDPSLPKGWTHHVDEECANIDYWFQQGTNKISFGRPIEESELPHRPEPTCNLEARAIQAEARIAASAPTFKQALASLQKSVANYSKTTLVGKGTGKGKGTGQVHSALKGQPKGNGKKTCEIDILSGSDV